MTKNELYQTVRVAFKKSRPEKIILFGSWARGEEDPRSDVDLIIIMRTSKRFMDRLAELYEAWPIPVPVDILAYTPEEFETMLSEENPLVMKAVNEGAIIYEKSPH